MGSDARSSGVMVRLSYGKINREYVRSFAVCAAQDDRILDAP